MISPARQLARDVLLAVEQREAYASDLLHSSLGRGLKPADQALATELVLGVLRWREQLDYLIQRSAHRPVARLAPLVRTALRLGLYQLRFLDRIPARAAVHESVEMTKEGAPHAAAFVNAVLRRGAGEAAEPMAAILAAEPEPARRCAVEFSHPAWLLERWSANFSPEAAAAIAEHNNRAPQPSFWLRAGEPPPELELAPGTLLRSAWRVSAGDATRTEAFRERRLFLQDEASQLIPFLLQAQAGQSILDLGAAPGGKTARLEAMVPGANLVGVELHLHRARLLRQRLQRLVSVVVADGTRRLPFRGKFDRILLDAPCTGTGTLDRNPEIRWRLQPGDPGRLARTQSAMLARAAAALAPGGRLVYSVCSIEPEEGAEVVEAFLVQHKGWRLRPAAEVVAALRSGGVLQPDLPELTAGPWLRIIPGSAGTAGFFAAILESAAF
ncbi:MAG: transcription antitermination factor NusB [Terriglobales bacterium]